MIVDQALERADWDLDRDRELLVALRRVHGLMVHEEHNRGARIVLELTNDLTWSVTIETPVS